METPVWKTSYRLVLSDQARPFLQGWAIVENTSDCDWPDVRLSLVSGRPVSFVMDLYQPLYNQRPVVQPEHYGSVKPPVYGESMEEQGLTDAGAAASAQRKIPQNLLRERLASGTAKAEVAPAAPAAAEPPLDPSQGVAAAAMCKETGELFQYVIDQPVTLPRQTSAMLPILNQAIEGQKVSIYNPSTHAKFPLNGIRIKNTSRLNLMQGRSRSLTEEPMRATRARRTLPRDRTA